MAHQSGRWSMASSTSPLSDDRANLLSRFRIDPNHGFLPGIEPLAQLPSAYDPWEALVADLPKLLVADRIVEHVAGLPSIDATCLSDREELERAMLVLSYIAHAYVWGTPTPQSQLPASIAVPWLHVAEMLNRPPVLSYASHALFNWRRYDRSKPPVLGNSARLLNFGGGEDEDWFVLIHI